MQTDLDSKGAGIYAEESNLRLISCEISRSKARSAGALYAIDSNITLIECVLLANSGEYQVSSVYLFGDKFKKESSLFVKNCMFINKFEMKVQGLGLIGIENLELVINDNFYVESYALTIIESRSVLFKNVTVRGTDYSGVGCLYILSKEKLSEIYLSNLKFKGIRSKFSGAAIKLEGKTKAIISESIFENNFSNENGGAIYIDGHDEELQSTLFIDCVFKNNSAHFSGNILKVKSSLPKFIKIGAASNILPSIPNNHKDFSSFASTVLILNGINLDRNMLRNYFSEPNTDENIFLKEIVSGQPVELTCAIFDHYYNLQEYSSEKKIKFIDPIPSNQTLTIQNGINMIQSGVAIFRDLIVIAEPNSTIVLAVNFFDEISEKEFYMNITLNVRNCVRGEIFTGRKCEVCSKNSFSLIENPIRNNVSICQACSSLAKCPGGDKIFPLEGFWRKDGNQTTIVECFNRAACPMASPLDQTKNKGYKANCGKSYLGNICANCEKGYGKSTSNACISCDSFLKYFFFLFISICMTIYQIHTAFSINEKEIKHRCLMKLLTNHLIFIGILSRFKIDWEPTTILILNLNYEYLTTIPSQIFYFDCFVDDFISPKNKFIANSILITISPFLLGFLNLFFLYIVKFMLVFFERVNRIFKIRNNRFEIKLKVTSGQKERSNTFNLKKDVIATCLIIFYNLYSKLLANALSWVKCIKIDDTDMTYLESDPDILCWSQKHFLILWSLTLPSFLFWIIIFPLGLIYSLSYFKRNLKRREQPLGEKLYNFMALDYQEQYYYWDAFSFITKLLLVLCHMSTNNLKSSTKGAIVIFILLVLFLIQEKLKPFKYRFVNNLLSCSYIVTLCTGASAIITSAEDLTDTQRILFLIVFLAFNLFFYLAWLFYLFKERVFLPESFKYISKGIYSKFTNFRVSLRKSAKITRKVSK